MSPRPADRDGFEIALICALRVEVDAVQAMFDTFWDEKDYGRAHGDYNQYTVGLIGEHNIVLAYLPGMGKVSAATVAAGMRPSFPNIKLALIVGVCGAVPRIASSQRDIFLGDLIISTALVQYDFGRQYPHAFEAKDNLTDAPSQQIRTFLNKLDSYYHRQQLESRLLEYLSEVECKLPETRYPGPALDCLYDPSYVHKHQPQSMEGSCDECSNEPDGSCHEAVSMSCDELGCEKTKLIQRSRKSDNLRPGVIPQPVVHFGRMASGDTVMKSGSHREKIAAAKTVIAFEMEGAGVWETFPSIVMKGVCDYADSHKSKGWQSHAAAVAAAGMKALLMVWEAGKPAMDKSTLYTTDLQCLKDFAGTGDPNVQRALILSEKDVLNKDFCSWIFESQSFHQWWNEPEARIWWIHGNPGKGKTMMAASLIDQIQSSLIGKHSTAYHQENGALTYFFCRASTQGLDDAISILRGLIFVLINENRTLLRYAVEQYVIYGKRLFDGTYGLQVLFQLLSKLTQSLSQVFVIIDGLDECGHLSEDFLQLLLSKDIKSSCKAKWVITSRNSAHITQELKDHCEVVHTGLEDNTIHVTQAVYRYIDQKVDQLKVAKTHDEGTTIQVAAYLKTNAEGTFLWAALVCKELMKARNRALRKTLAILRNFPPGLTPLYTRMAQQITEITDPDDQECCTWILRTALLTFRPLQTVEFRYIARAPSHFDGQAADVEDLIVEHIPFLTVRDGLVEFVHHSVREYLFDMPEMWPFDDQKEQPSNSKQMNILKAHKDCANHLLELISTNSATNICKLSHSGILCKDIGSDIIARCVSPYVQYACAHWVDHYTWQPSVVVGSPNLAGSNETITDGVGRFFAHDFLFWTEVLSLTGNISVSMAAIAKLHTHWLQKKLDLGLRDLVHDAKRFVAHNKTILEVAPLQIYVAGLLFSPMGSLIHQNYKHKFQSAIELVSYPRIRWSSCLQVFEGHVGSVESVRFSPNGRVIASASMDGTIILWDLVTGARLHTLKGHKDYISSISFSPDGTLLASGSGDRRVRIWDVISGTVRKEFKGHTSAVEVVTFSPNGILVGSGAWDGTVRIWSTKTGQLERDFTGHANIVEAICFLPCGIRCASASWDGTVRLWNIETGVTEKIFEEYSARVRSLAISSKGTYLAYGSDNMKIVLWNAIQDTTQILSGAAGSVRSITFSQNEAVVASGCEEATVCWWNTKDAKDCSMRRDHAGPIRTVQFLDDNLIVSGSLDGTCKMIDVRNNELISTYRGHFSCVGTVASSPTDRTMISGSWDRTVRLWDCEPITGDENQSSSHFVAIQAMTVSVEEDLLLTGFEDGTIKIWNLKTNQVILESAACKSAITCVVFSPDGIRFAAVSVRNEISVGSLAGSPCWTYQSPKQTIESCSFSSNGRFVVAKLKGKQTCLLDAYSGAVLVEELIATPTIIPCASENAFYLIERRVEQALTRVLEFETPVKEDTARSWRPAEGFEFFSDRSPFIFSPDGRHFAAVRGLIDKTDTVVVYATSTGTEIQTYHDLPPGSKFLALTTDGMLVTTSNGERDILVFNNHDRGFERWQRPERYHRIKLTPCGNHILLLSVGHNIVDVLDIATGRSITRLHVIEDADEAIFMTAGLVVIVASRTGAVGVWDTANWSMLRVFHITPTRVDRLGNMVATSDGLLMVTRREKMYEREVVELWDVNRGVLMEIYHSHLNEIEKLAVSTTGLFVLVGGLYDGLPVWDLAEQAFVPLSRKSTFNSDRNVIEIWDRASCLVRIIPRSIMGRIEQLSLHPDGSLAVWSDGQIKLWDVQSLQQVAARICVKESLRCVEDISTLLQALEIPPNGQKTISIENELHNVRVRYHEIYLSDDNDDFVCSNNDDLSLDLHGRHEIAKKDRTHTSQKTTDCAVDATNSWIMYKGTRVLRLPADLRSDVHCCTNDTVILGSTTGEPTILRIRPEMLKLGLEL